MPVHVTSEIGALRTVLVHSPGNELLAVTPSTRADFLYDDIVDADLARREHRRFVQVLERFCEVLHVRDLLTQVLEDSEVRELIIRETLDVVPSEPLAAELRALPPAAVVNLLIEGKEEEPGDVRGPIRTERGFVVLQLVERKSGDLRPYDEIKDQLRKQLYEQQVEKGQQSWLRELRKKAHVDIRY